MGEGGWSAFEVIIVLILVIALLGRIFGTNLGIKSTTDTAVKPKEEKVITATKTCGKIFVVTPVSLQKISAISNGIPVQASIEPCPYGSITPSGSYIITIVDSAAIPVADPVEVQIQSNGTMSGFNQFVPFVTKPKTGTGYLIITRTANNNSGQSEDGARVPIRFVN